MTQQSEIQTTLQTLQEELIYKAQWLGLPTSGPTSICVDISTYSPSLYLDFRSHSEMDAGEAFTQFIFQLAEEFDFEVEIAKPGELTMTPSSISTTTRDQAELTISSLMNLLSSNRANLEISHLEPGFTTLAIHYNNGHIITLTATP